MAENSTPGVGGTEFTATVDKTSIEPTGSATTGTGPATDVATGTQDPLPNDGTTSGTSDTTAETDLTTGSEQEELPEAQKKDTGNLYSDGLL